MTVLLTDQDAETPPKATNLFEEVPTITIHGADGYCRGKYKIVDDVAKEAVQRLVSGLHKAHHSGWHMEEVLREALQVPEEHWSECAEIINDELNKMVKEAGGEFRRFDIQPIPDKLFESFRSTLGTKRYAGSSLERRIILRHTYFNREHAGLQYLADMARLLAESARKNEMIDATEAAIILSNLATHIRTAARVYEPERISDQSAAALRKEVGIFSVEKASEMTGVPEIEILDAIRTDQLRGDYQGQPGFPVPFTGTTICHRSYIALPGDEIDRIHPNFDHRRNFLPWIGDTPDWETPVSMVKKALLCWYGALLDDPDDQEAAGVVQALTAFAEHLGIRSDGTVAERSAVAEAA